MCFLAHARDAKYAHPSVSGIQIKRPLPGPFSHRLDAASCLAAHDDRDHVVIVDEHRRIAAALVGTARDARFYELVTIDFLHFKYSPIMD